MTTRTLYRKIVDAHTVRALAHGDDAAGPILLYVDRQILNEYTSPQAFAARRLPPSPTCVRQDSGRLVTATFVRRITRQSLRTRPKPIWHKTS